MYFTYEGFVDGVLVDRYPHHQVNQMVKAPEVTVQRPTKFKNKVILNNLQFQGTTLQTVTRQKLNRLRALN
jgi:hypothetical protein